MVLRWQHVFSVFLWLTSVYDGGAFVSEHSPVRPHHMASSATCSSTNADCESHNERASSPPSRRRIIQTTASVVVTALLGSREARAEDNIFRKNPLTNPVLEQIRIWEQAEADELKYGGELERGNAGNKGKVDAYPSLLLPILEMSDDLAQVNTLVRDGSVESWKQAQALLSQTKYDKVPFKKIFNRYGDNIYYSDPDRANAYLGGGASPKTEQSLAYLLRNDILTNIEALQAELDYLLKDTTPDSEKEDTDLRSYADIASGAMKKYLALVPPNELKQAQALMATNKQ